MHKWMWFSSFAQHVDESLISELVLPMVCLWMVPLLLAISMRPVLELDCEDDFAGCDATVRSPPRSPVTETKLDIGGVTWRSPKGRQAQKTIDPLFDSEC